MAAINTILNILQVNNGSGGSGSGGGILITTDSTQYTIDTTTLYTVDTTNTTT